MLSFQAQIKEQTRQSITDAIVKGNTEAAKVLIADNDELSRMVGFKVLSQFEISCFEQAIVESELLK